MNEQMIDKDSIKKLIQISLDMRAKSYAPYSKFNVGAALLCSDGLIYTGANIENSSYGMTMCAERTAVFKAVSEDHKDFAAIAITSGKSGEEKLELCPPCGACRQVLSEFCKSDILIILARSTSDYEVHTLGELLPLTFGAESLNNA